MQERPSKRPRTGKPGGKPSFSGKSYTSKRPISAPGLFVTCTRGKEGKCVGEMYDLLEEMADRLYPSERVEELAKLRPVAVQTSERGETLAEVAGEDPAQPANDGDSDQDDSIEASVARELAKLKATSTKGAKGKGQAHGDDAEEKNANCHRFLSVRTDTDCVLYIAFGWPYDPVEIAEALVREAQDTGVLRSRFIKRLEPVSHSCHSKSDAQVQKLVADVVEKEFLAFAARTDRASFTYKIDPSLRSPPNTLNRDIVIELIGASIRSLSAPSLTDPSRPVLSLSADLKNPDLVVVPTVLKSVFGLGVVDGKLWTEGKRFNLDGVTAEWRKAQELKEGVAVNESEREPATS